MTLECSDPQLDPKNCPDHLQGGHMFLGSLIGSPGPAIHQVCFSPFLSRPPGNDRD